MDEAKLSRRLKIEWLRWVRLALTVLLLPALSCANPLRMFDKNIEHAKHGYRVSIPHSENEKWERSKVPGAGLSFVSNRTNSSISLLSYCSRVSSRASLEVLAKQLLIGLRPDSTPVLESVTVDDQPGVSQRFTTFEEGVLVSVKTVTTTKATCQYDFILTAPENFEVLEADFDRWWNEARLFIAEPSK
jgi:hypothetical protein